MELLSWEYGEDEWFSELSVSFVVNECSNDINGNGICDEDELMEAAPTLWRAIMTQRPTPITTVPTLTLTATASTMAMKSMAAKTGMHATMWLKLRRRWKLCAPGHLRMRRCHLRE